jgi:hypothetical protein
LLSLIPEMVSGTGWALYNLRLWGALGLFSPTLPKLTEAFANVAGKTPLPLNVAVWGLLGASSVTVSVAVRVPSAEGVNVTVMRQLFPGPSVLGRRGQFPPQA